MHSPLDIVHGVFASRLRNGMQWDIRMTGITHVGTFQWQAETRWVTVCLGRYFTKHVAISMLYIYIYIYIVKLGMGWIGMWQHDK